MERRLEPIFDLMRRAEHLIRLYAASNGRASPYTIARGRILHRRISRYPDPGPRRLAEFVLAVARRCRAHSEWKAAAGRDCACKCLSLDMLRRRLTGLYLKYRRVPSQFLRLNKLLVDKCPCDLAMRRIRASPSNNTFVRRQRSPIGKISLVEPEFDGWPRHP